MKKTPTGEWGGGDGAPGDGVDQRSHRIGVQKAQKVAHAGLFAFVQHRRAAVVLLLLFFGAPSKYAASAGRAMRLAAKIQTKPPTSTKPLLTTLERYPNNLQFLGQNPTDRSGLFRHWHLRPQSFRQKKKLMHVVNRLWFDCIPANGGCFARSMYCCEP